MPHSEALICTPPDISHRERPQAPQYNDQTDISAHDEDKLEYAACYCLCATEIWRHVFSGGVWVTGPVPDPVPDKITQMGRSGSKQHADND